jgi:uroporphyrinogen decarboxylase
MKKTAGSMTNRERALAVLNYESYDRLPIVHFGFWTQTLAKWRQEGHLTDDDIAQCGDSSPKELALARKLGFDFNWQSMFFAATGLKPAFESKVVEELPDGSRKVLNADGVVVLQRDDAISIPAEVDHLFKTRRDWETHYRPRLQFDRERINWKGLEELKQAPPRPNPLGIHCGSLYGEIRNWLGVEGSSYLYADDELLFREVIDAVGSLCYRCAESMLATGASFDFGHFWEDICFKNGPLIVPSVFDELVGPHYRRLTDLLREHGITIVSLDCDGKIDALIPTWFENGVNTMFPIEVGTWNASILPWRKKYGKELRGVGGMNKTVFAHDFAAIDREIERLKPLVDLGGYLPCPDHRLAPDAKWDNVRHYCDRMRQVFG